MTTLATPDARALLVALDAGDDSALPILADLLEEAGDERADGLRCIGTESAREEVLWRPQQWKHGEWIWEHRSTRAFASPCRLRGNIFNRLSGGRRTRWHRTWGNRIRIYPSRSAALLALATALIAP